MGFGLVFRTAVVEQTFVYSGGVPYAEATGRHHFSAWEETIPGGR